VLARAVVVALVTLALVPMLPAPARGATWTVDTASRTANDIRAAWEQFRPAYSGAVHAVAPSTTAPYATGTVAPGYIDDGLRIINFARYLAGLPADVVTTPTLNNQAQHGAVLLAASNFSHTPAKPSDMPQSFYDAGLSSTSSSNIGSGYADAESFQRGCLADSGASNLARVGHRRWLLNPPMKQTGIGSASNRLTTYAFDNSRTDTVSFDRILWPAEGQFPVEFFDSRTPWSIQVNPDRFDWDTSGHRVTLRRVSDGRTWTFDANDTNTAGEYFNADFGYYGVRNAFIFRPDPASVAYNAGDSFDVTLEGGFYAKGTRTPAKVTYRTTFMSLDGPIQWPAGLTVTEIQGENRIATAIETSRRAFESGAGTVLIATAYNWPDALGGSALAGAVNGPILLTDPNTLPATVANEIRRLKATRAIILGGTGAVSADVQKALAVQLGSAKVTRIAGVNRYETARKIAAETVAKLEKAPGGYDGTAFVATGASFPDALGASPLAAAKGWPIYLVDPRGVDSVTTAAMTSVGVERVLVLGGPGAVPQANEIAIKAALGCSLERLAGTDRYQTAAAVASYGVAKAGMSYTQVAIATGANFPDALAGGVLQGRCGSVMLLTPSNSLHTTPKALLTANKGTIDEVRFLGGSGALTTGVRSAVADALR
jgi:putative cell wall-binding protein/uncharacterized protein YkwD